MSRVDVISIGTLERNRLWNEQVATRTAHATTSLIRAGKGGKRHIVVDPGLPAPVLVARFAERTGLSPDAVHVVFLTNFTVAHRAGLAAFSKARVFLWEPELDHARAHAREMLERQHDDDELRAAAEEAIALLDRIEPAPDKLDDDVDLFPLPGHTPGTAGLLVTSPALTTLIAGDGVPTQDHFLAGQVLPDAHDLAQAQESLREAYEIADLILPGHDNLFLNPRTQGLG